MTNPNLSEGLESLSRSSRELHRRAEIILDRLIGPRPTEAENAAHGAGIVGFMDSVAEALQRLERAISVIENVVGDPGPGAPPHLSAPGGQNTGLRHKA